MSTDKQNYFPYYADTLDHHETGLKLVFGGTGIGKTSIIPYVVKAYPNHKFIYVANRKRLLKEMEEDAQSILGKSAVVHIHRDPEQVLKAIDAPEFDTGFEAQICHDMDSVLPPQLHYDKVLNSVDRIRRLRKTDVKDNDLYEILSDDSRQIMRFFRVVAQHEDIGSYPATRQIVENLFPFLQFRQNPEINLALVTLQKLFYGVFDGEKDASFNALENYVIFLDEFDFLEQNLLDLLCDAPEIDNLFEFVAPFIRVITARLSSSGYAQEHQDLKRRLKTITDAIKQLQEHIDFPTHTQCFLQRGAEIPEKGVQIFQTKHTITAAKMRVSRILCKPPK
jgi:hypothetical protein